MKPMDLILKADGIASRYGYNQSQWSRNAGHANNGQTVSRMINRGDCKMSTFIDLLDAIGCSLEIKEGEQ